MNKTIFIFFTLLGMLLITPSCNDRKTYADYLYDEEKAIDLFIAQKELSILEEYPTSGNFAENEFYKDPVTGVYYNVISYGDTTTNLAINQIVYIRFRDLHYFMSEDTTYYSNMVYPLEIKYMGPVNSTTQSYYSNPGWMVPLEHVGHNGEVKMIIPFTMGSSNDRSQYQPSYYDLVQYRFQGKY